LFENGLWFGAVVRGLVEQLGYSEEQATLAAQTAASGRLVTEAPAEPII